MTNANGSATPATEMHKVNLSQVVAWVRLGLSESKIYVLFLVLVLISSIASPAFVTEFNITNLLSQASLIGILALAQFLVILIGGFDLSVAGVMAFGSVLTASIAPQSVPLALLVTLSAGAGLGLLSGLAVTYGRVHPMIATIGVMGIARGLAFAITEKSILVPAAIVGPYQFTVGVLSGPTIIWIVLTLMLAWFLARTRIGRHIYAVGGNERTARLAGIAVNRLKLMIYSLAGSLSGLAGIALVVRSSSGVPMGGTNWELDTIAAVVIGGTRMFGGEGNVVKAMVGVLIYLMISNIMNLVSLNPYYQDIVKAAFIVVIVGASATSMRRKRVSQ
jgi:ribose transport system permease protein